MHTVVLAETEADVRDALACGSDDVSIWLAVTPAAIAALRARGLDYLIPEDLLSRGEIETLCVSAYEELRMTVIRMDELTSSAEGGGRLFWHTVHEVGDFVDAVVMRSMVLEKLIERYPGHRLLARPTHPAAETGTDWSLGRPGSFWGLVAGCMPALKNVKWLDPLKVVHPERSGVRQRLGNLVRRSRIGWSVATSWRRGLHRNVRKLLLGGRPGVAVVGAPYEWESVLPLIESSGRTIHFIRPQSFLPEWGRGESKSDLRDKVASLWDGYVRKLQCNAVEALGAVRGYLADLSARAVRLRRALETGCGDLVQRRSVQLTLNAVDEKFATQIVLDTFRSQGCKVVKWLHGAAWRNRRINQRYDDRDLSTADHHFVFGDGVRRAYEADGRHRQCRVHSIGSGRLERQMTPASGCAAAVKRSVLYITTNYYINGWYCGFTPPFMDGTYYHAQLELIAGLQKGVEGDPDRRLTVKLPPSYISDYPPAWADELRGQARCRVVVREVGLAELYAEHEIVVIDCPTTVLLEAILRRRKVFVLTSVVGWSSADLELLKKRVVCADSPGELADKVDDFLRSGEYPADLDNREFIDQFGVHQAAGSAVDRAMDELHGILATETA